MGRLERVNDIRQSGCEQITRACTCSMLTQKEACCSLAPVLNQISCTRYYNRCQFSVAVRMKYMYVLLSLGFIVWLNINLSQVVAGQDESIYRILPRQGVPDVTICTAETFWSMQRCAKDLIPLISNGFPWGVPDVQQQRDTLKDPLDPINHVCGVFDDFLNCLDKHEIEDACLPSGDGQIFRIHTVFTFLCHKQPRSTDLLHSLRCLKETRVVDLLMFYLADRTGTHIDDMAQGTVNALFRFMDSDLLLSAYYIGPFAAEYVVTTGLLCLPESVIHHDVSFIVRDKCGVHAADIVRSYYIYYRRRFRDFLDEAGYCSAICDKETKGTQGNTTEIEANGVVAPEDDVAFITLFDHFLEENSPGTAMATIYGRSVRYALQTIKYMEFCDPPFPLSLSFEACLLLSYVRSGKGVFNILEFAHSVILPFPIYTGSSSKVFRSCWNLLQQICGANTSYHEYSYRVSAGSREIQRMMDNLTCGWQDMLIGRYIEASEQGNIWPTGYNAPENPLFLSSGIYSLGNLGDSMADLLRVVNQGVKEISARCSKSSAKRVSLFYHRLNYSWYDTLKLLQMIRDEYYHQRTHRRTMHATHGGLFDSIPTK